jgi:AcrR family transcriptional regulator
LNDAFLDLIIEKGYDAITVQDLIDRANVGRTTFYSHFQDKEQLLINSINRIRELIVPIGTSRVIEGNSVYPFHFSLAIIQHVQSHKRIYNATVGRQSGAIVLHHFKCLLRDIIFDEMTTHLLNPSTLEIPQEVVIDYMTQAFHSLLTWWLDNQTPCSATELDSMFHTLVLSGIGAYMKGEIPE